MTERLVTHLRAERAKRGLTQAHVAALVGVSRKTINTIENGLVVPSTLLALRLARVFAIPVESLFQIID